MEMWQKVTAEKTKEQEKVEVKPKKVEKPKPKPKPAPKKVEEPPVKKYKSLEKYYDDDMALPEYEPIPVDPSESTAGIYDQFLSDSKPRPHPRKVAAAKPAPAPKPVRQKTGVYNTFTEEQITFEDRDENELDADISVYAKVAANNAEVDAPKGTPHQELAVEESADMPQKPSLMAGEPDPENWF